MSCTVRGCCRIPVLHMPGFTLALLDGLCILHRVTIVLRLAPRSGHVCGAQWFQSLPCSVHLLANCHSVCTLAAGAVLLPLS